MGFRCPPPVLEDSGPNDTAASASRFSHSQRSAPSLFVPSILGNRGTSLKALLTLWGLAGCNAVLGIDEATLTCGGATCDAGLYELQAQDGGIGSAVISVDRSGNSSPGAPAAGGGSSLTDAGPDATSSSREVVGNLPLAPNGSGNQGPGNQGPGNQGPGSGNGTPTPTPTPPPSPCAGRPAGEAFCSEAVRTNCGPNGSVERALSCQSAAHCQQSTGSECATCLSSDVRCDGSVLLSCNAARNGFDALPCVSAPLCDAVGRRCLAPACDPNQSQCNGAALERCNPDSTAFEPALTCESPQLCNAPAGSCNACIPGTSRCADNNTQATCDSSGQAEVQAFCSVIEACVAGRCQVVVPPLF